MSDASADEQFHGIVRGAEAFVSEAEGREADVSRAGQYLGMAAYAFGDDAMALDMREDADLLGVPHVVADESIRGWSSQAALDDLTASVEEGTGSLAHELQAVAAVRADIDATHRPELLLALLNARQHTESPVEAAAAAAGLLAFSPELETSIEVLQRMVDSRDSLARGIALATLGRSPSGAASTPLPAQITDATSVTVHGTWALLDDDGWYTPDSDLHRHLRDEVKDNLYRDRGYFYWTGEYSEPARRQGGQDLTAWARSVSSADRLDLVYAHSHGGNVALNAAAAGQRINLLVLMHTPAILRSDEEWAAIHRNVGQVIVMRTRLDVVVTADVLASYARRGPRSLWKFNPAKMPHFSINPTAREVGTPLDLWSHGYFVRLDTWERHGLADRVLSRYRYVR